MCLWYMQKLTFVDYEIIWLKIRILQTVLDAFFSYGISVEPVNLFT
jgi:hypothetical protein